MHERIWLEKIYVIAIGLAGLLMLIEGLRHIRIDREELTRKFRNSKEMTDINGDWLKDIHFRGRCLRVFFHARLKLPYFFHDWGFYGFGAGPFGFMYWPPDTPEQTAHIEKLIREQCERENAQ